MARQQMRLVGFRINGRGYQEVLNADDVRRELTKLMDPVLLSAKENAPVATGAYRDGLHIEQGTTDRVQVRVQGNTDHDYVVEARSGNLARALGSARR